MTLNWRPRSRRGVADPEYDALHEGVPPWLTNTLLRFVVDHIGARDSFGQLIGQPERLLDLERRLHIRISQQAATQDFDAFLARLQADDDLMLDVVDVVVGWARDWEWGGEIPDSLLVLEQSLKEAGSAWEVMNYQQDSRLERRVNATVTAAAREVMSTSGRAGQHLAAAWMHVYGRSPSASEGYREAVRAVEVAAIPIVIPDDTEGTLGKVITALRDAPGKWHVVMTPSGATDPVAAVRHMCELLWKSQWDRHGVPDESVPLNVSLEESQAAVHLATALVQWFTSGAVTQNP